MTNTTRKKADLKTTIPSHVWIKKHRSRHHQSIQSIRAMGCSYLDCLQLEPQSPVH